MLVGMGTVFSFLTVLVLGMTMMSAFVGKFLSPVSDPEISKEEVAAISAALAQHRNTKSK